MKNGNKTVLVTGSGTGIGQAIARKFAKFGYNIIILGRRKEPLMEATDILKEIVKNEGHDSKISYYPGVDVSDEVGINQMFEQIKKDYGQIDIIVNNAGISGPVKVFTNSSYEDFKDCVSIHLTGSFWTSIKGLEVLKGDGKIITISTFFTEENKFEQRPYRFRTPYTAAQGAKNRLSEALAWDLVEKGIKSVCTNPGPVHSDRIYKTVYPKAAAEFLRIGGFEGMTNKQIEDTTTKLLPYLGDDEEIIKKESFEMAKELNEKNPSISIEQYQDLAIKLLQKVQEIAEKVQNNTRKMIVDNEFLSQDDVAEMVFTLSSNTISKLVNGRIIPNDRVFYPVKPIVNKNINYQREKILDNKVILLTTTSTDEVFIKEIQKIAQTVSDGKIKQLIVLTDKNEISQVSNEIFKNFHHHNIDLKNEDIVRKIFNTIETHFGKIDTAVHFTGNYDFNKDITSYSRRDWDKLVERFIYIPHLLTRESVLSMAGREAYDKPHNFKQAKGNIVIIGPQSPIGKKISGKIRSHSEIFRGALRPYVTTANQELHDVLNSKINLTLLLQGNIEGENPNYQKLAETIITLGAQDDLTNNIIIYVDE